MTNGTVLLSENTSLFTAVSQVNYEVYKNERDLELLQNNKDIQCVIGHIAIPFGHAQNPQLTDYADGVDIMNFALSLQQLS